MHLVSLILMVFAFVLAVVASAVTTTARGIHLGWLAFALFVLAQLLVPIATLH